MSCASGGSGRLPPQPSSAKSGNESLTDDRWCASAAFAQFMNRSHSSSLWGVQAQTEASVVARAGAPVSATESECSGARTKKRPAGGDGRALGASKPKNEGGSFLL